MTEHSLNRNAGITSRPRPVKVCYVVNADETCEQILDAIFADSYSRWGGRSTLIVPVVQGKISPQYRSWIRYFDPDVVYPCMSLGASLLEVIEQTTSPSLFHRWNDRTPGQYVFHWDLQFLHSFSVLPALRTAAGILQPKPRLIVDAYPGWEGDRFITDCFGTRTGSASPTMSWPIAEQLREFIGSLAFLPVKKEIDLRHMVKAAEDITSSIDLLMKMTKDGSIVTMNLLSSTLTETEVPYGMHPWSRSFNLVIGSSVLDRISFWNSRLNYEGWLQQSLVALCIPASHLAEQDFIEALTEFIRQRNFVGNNGGSSRQLTIRSSEVDEAAVQPLRTAFQKKFQISNFEKIHSFDDCVPPEKSMSDNGYERPVRATQFTGFREFRLDAPLPRHLTDYGLVPPQASIGAWAVDVKIERHERLSAFSNDEHWWKLPPRTASFREFADDTPGRVTNHGRLSFQQSVEDKSIKVHLPKDHDLIRALLRRERPWYSVLDARQGRELGLYDFIDTSDKGTYLRAAIELFGSLANAYSVLSNPFWTQMFQEMAFPAKNTDDDKQEEIVRRLKSTMNVNHGPLTIATPDEWRSLADAAARLAVSLKKPRAIRSYGQFLKAYKKHLSTRAKTEKTSQESNDEAIERELRAGLTRRCAERVLTQGRESKCRNCGYHNWVSLKNIAPSVKCVICGHKGITPADFRWDFHLNDLLAEGLREHGLLGPLMSLGELQSKCRESFLYEPSLNLFAGYPGSEGAEKTEIDFCCLTDGKLTIGEAKLTARDFNENENKKIIAIANAVRPDRVILSSLEATSSAKLSECADAVKGGLNYSGCSVEALIPTGGLWAMTTSLR